MRYLAVLLITIVHTITGFGQITPREGSKLNYRLAGLSVPVDNQAHNYSFEISLGTHANQEDFDNHKIITENTKENSIVTKLPRFSQDYTWRVTYISKDRSTHYSPFYHFKTDRSPLADTGKFRLRIIDSARAYKDMLVILDTRVMYDVTGEPLWYLPNIPGVLDDVTVTRDLKPTPFGTFTFLKDNQAYEVDYNGTVLWEAPQAAVRRDSQANYHHDFTRLENGHYLIADQEDIIVTDSLQKTQTLKWGTLVEFDTSKKVVWYWSSGSYFLNAEKYKPSKGQYAVNTHLNAFYFDERKKVIYLSFRNISSILKIAYPSGEVLADYDGIKDSLFRAQHHCRINKKGNLYLFNNNTDKEKVRNTISGIGIFKELSGKKKSLKELWDFSCVIDSNATPTSTGGGSVYELDKGAILSCMGFAARVFIVAPDKRILWNALPERMLDNKWVPYPQYRTSYIENKKELRKFIFH